MHFSSFFIATLVLVASAHPQVLAERTTASSTGNCTVAIANPPTNAATIIQSTNSAPTTTATTSLTLPTSTTTTTITAKNCTSPGDPAQPTGNQVDQAIENRFLGAVRMTMASNLSHSPFVKRHPQDSALCGPTCSSSSASCETAYTITTTSVSTTTKSTTTTGSATATFTVTTLIPAITTTATTCVSPET